MRSGSPAQSTSIRPPDATPVEERGGSDIAECEEVGIKASCRLPRARQDHQDMAEVNGVDDKEDVVGEEEVTTPEEEEAEAVQCLPTPDTPTLSDVLAHRATHYPYRPWCPDCVEGRGREFGHLACQPREGRSVPTVSFDYCFVGDKGDIETQLEADAEPGSIKVLVVRDNRSKAFFAHTVPVKGADEGGFAVKAIANDVIWLGYSRLW